jgi:hypothetical protein
MVVTGALTYLSIPKRENPAITVRAAIVAAQFLLHRSASRTCSLRLKINLCACFRTSATRWATVELPEGTRGLSVNTDFCDVAIATIAVTGERFS